MLEYTGTYTVRRTVGSGSVVDRGFKWTAALLAALDSLLSPEHPKSARQQARISPVRPVNPQPRALPTLIAARVPQEPEQAPAIRRSKFSTATRTNTPRVVQTSISEIKVSPEPYPVEFGHSTGGVVSVIKKTGTNNLQGMASDFGREGRDATQKLLRPRTPAERHPHAARGLPGRSPGICNGPFEDLIFASYEPSVRSCKYFFLKALELVRKRGFEPPRPCGHKLLRLARLPVPPLPHEVRDVLDWNF